MKIGGLQMSHPFLRHLGPALFSLLLLYIFAQTAVASSLVLSAPAEMDVSTESTCWLNYTFNEDVVDPFARLELAPGFDYSGDCRLMMDGTASDCPPGTAGRVVEWDLGDAMQERKHPIINEWDQNPPGSDTGREWIEIYNPTGRAVDIGGWKIADSRSAKAMAINAGTTIGPGGYLLINWTQAALINSDYTSLILLDASGQEVDRTSPGKDEKNSNLCWGRRPNGKDLDSDSDWLFQMATPGLSNGGSMADIYSGQSLALKFNITAGCTAPRQGRLSASMASSAGTLASSASDVAARRANLSLSVTPDRYDLARGDVISWRVLLENSGDGAAHAVAVNATLDGQKMLGVDKTGQRVNWTVACLPPGGREEIGLQSQVTATQESYKSLFSATWGAASLPCQEESQMVEQGQRTALRKSPDEPRRLAIGETAGFAISADLPAGACDLWINDTIAPGLVYNESSISLHGLALESETRAVGPDGSLLISWRLRDSPSARQAEISYNCLVENGASSQDGAELPGEAATMCWLEGAAASSSAPAIQKSDSDTSGPIIIVEPDLSLQMNASRAAASPGDAITFTLAAAHTAASSAPAYDLDLQIMLPGGLTYQPGSAKSGPGALFDEEALCWHLPIMQEEVDGGSDGGSAIFSFNATCHAAPGQTPLARALLTWSSRPGSNAVERTGGGGVNDYHREAAAFVAAASLTLTKAADPDPVQVGGDLAYTLTYQYRGNGSVHNVVIRDQLDEGVALVSSDPEPAESGKWIIPILIDDGPHTITMRVRVKETLLDGALLQNCHFIGCDELGVQPVGCIQTAVHNGSRLAVTKSAMQKAVRRGEEADYLITVCNRGGQAATNITVRDVFDSEVEVISLWPQTSQDGLWHFASLEPGGCLQMGLSVRIPRSDAAFQSSGSVAGQGFVRSYRDLSTARPAGLLSNRVYVTADGMSLTASANVSILAEQGTGLSQRQHGSGNYSSREDLEYLTANKSIRLERDVEADYQPASISLPGGRVQGLNSLWSDQILAENAITNTSLVQSYRYARRMKAESSISVDKNESKMSLNSSFEGTASLAARKMQGEKFSSYEQYAGSFQISEKLHDAGSGLTQDRAASGFGYVDKRTAGRDGRGRGLQSRESGTGSFRVQEHTDTFSGYMSKELNASFAGVSLPAACRTSLNISQRWSEAMASTTPNSLISEEYGSATRLDMNSTSESPWERRSEASFSGVARLRTLLGSQNNGSSSGGSGGSSMDVDREESYQGDFFIKRSISLAGPARYDHPHLRLIKEGRLGGDVASYTITMANDGSAALGPLFLQDIFPPGASFINSSLRPVRLESNSSNWTVLHLAISDEVKIDINLDVGNCSGDIINHAAVMADCSQGPVAVQNSSVIFRESLGCCPPERSGGETADPVGEEAEAEADSASGCACLAGSADSGASNGSIADFLSPDLLALQWGGGDGDDGGQGSCPLSCPAVEEAHHSVR
jgi:uncharacterized repeat protein (TIGR01451 family)